MTNAELMGIVTKMNTVHEVGLTLPLIQNIIMLQKKPRAYKSCLTKVSIKILSICTLKIMTSLLTPLTVMSLYSRQKEKP